MSTWCAPIGVRGFPLARPNAILVLTWTRKIWLGLLLLSWALAIGLHDYVLSDHDHDHIAGGPETVITQVWQQDVTPVVPMVPVVAVVAILLITLLLRIPLQLQQGRPPAPESLHSPPRPPTLKNLLFRGPPARTLPTAKSRKCEKILCPKISSRCSGWLYACLCVPSLLTAAR